MALGGEIHRNIEFFFIKKSVNKLSVRYAPPDESEIIIKILMFGPNMKVLEPKDVINSIERRINYQVKLFY